MVHKPKISRKKKKKIKGKKTFVKKDVFEDEAPLTHSINSPQTSESSNLASDEEKKTCEELIAPPKDEKNNLPISYPKKYLLFQLVSLLLLTFIVYSGTLDHSFHFDDKSNIRSNHFIQISSLSLDELRKAGLESENHQRPVANISFALNYYFHGLEVRGYHYVNIFIHLLAGIILYYFVKATLCLPLYRDKYSKSQFIPFFTALIWMVHPLHTQSVTYIVQRMNSMAGMFFIMTMLFYVKARLTPEKTKKILLFSFSLIASIFAFGSKQNTATLPLFVLLYEWYFFQDLRLKFSRKQLFWIAAIGCMFVLVLFLFLGSSPLDRLFPSYAGRPFSMAERVLTQPRVVLLYILLIFYPAPSLLNLDYDFPLSYSLLSPSTTLLSILVLVVLLGVAIYAARNKRLYSFCILWFMGNLVIESSTIPLEIIFEHRTYLPSMMVILLIVLLLHQAVKKRRVLIVFLTAVAILFSYWTYERNKVWKNELTLWTDIQKKSPNKARANHNLGLAYFEKNRLDEAIPVLEKALYLYEQQSNQGKYVKRIDTSSCLRLLGNAFRMRGEYKKAIEHLDRALKESSNTANDVKTYFLLGLCYGQILRAQEAVFYFSKALQLSQNFYDVPWMHEAVDDIKLFLEKSRFLLEEQKKTTFIKRQE